MQGPQQRLTQYWGYKSFRAPQEDIINALVSCQDVLAVLPTGSGKSLCYQIPGLLNEGICVVISPLVALMEDQVNDLMRRNIKAIALAGPQSPEEMMRIFDLFRHGGYKFLYVAPERLKQELVLDFLKTIDINLWAIDEAHCIAQWGFDFRPAYQQLKVLRQLQPQTPILALTGTATEEITAEITNALELREPKIFSRPLIKENIQLFIEQREDVFERILAIAKAQKGSGIVYVPTRKLSEQYAHNLKNKGLDCAFFHGGMDQKQKQTALKNWLTRPAQVMVATSAFGMGINHVGVRFVIHTFVPDAIESYIQEIGRAGRDGAPAQAWLIYHQHDIAQFKRRKKNQILNTEDIKQFYRHLCNYFQIAYGEGAGEIFGLAVGEFCTIYDLNPTTAMAALNILDRIGIISLKHQYGSKTRLQFIAENTFLNDALDDNPGAGMIGRNILRLYGGVFQSKISIDLYQLARKTGVTIEQIKAALIWMQQRELIDLEMFQTDLQLTFLLPREDARSVNPHRAIIERHAKRVRAQERDVLDFIHQSQGCLKQKLARYFGQVLNTDCGQCSNCLSRKKQSSANAGHAIAELILNLLKDQNLTIFELRENINFDPIDIDTVLTYLHNEQKIGIDAANRYFLR
ncbi:MAG: RecQ family ATP-dependent DNA helicase [Bacteroidetes bacterium]|nr:RecQ family ATP-dependent DNA helicase [Bacteroidota bacterium]